MLLGSEQPWITIVIPTMNAAAALAETLDSIADQAMEQRHVEVVVADGGSSDDTVQLLTSRKTEISRFVSIADSGIAHAINRGIALSVSPVINIVCAGDRLPSHQVRMALDLLAENPGCGFVYGDVEMVDLLSGKATRRASGVDEFHRCRFDSMAVAPHPSVFARRTVYEQVGVLDRQFRFSSDFDWIARCWGHGIRGKYASDLCVKSPEGGATNRHANVRDFENLTITLRYNTMPRAPAYRRYWSRLTMNFIRNRLEAIGARNTAYAFRRLVDLSVRPRRIPAHADRA